MQANGHDDPVQAMAGLPLAELIPDLRGRVARQLLVLAGDGNENARTSVTQAELASMVSGARQTVNQALRSLESRGCIRASGRSFEILDRERLEDLTDR